MENQDFGTERHSYQCIVSFLDVIEQDVVLHCIYYDGAIVLLVVDDMFCI